MAKIKGRAAAEEIASGCFAARVRLLNRVTTAIYDKALRPFGLKTSQANILVVTGARGPLRGVDLCEILQLEKSTLSRDLQRLVDKRWIDVQQDKGNSRMLTLTVAGYRMLEKIRPSWRRAQVETKRELGAEFCAEAMATVDRLRLSRRE